MIAVIFLIPGVSSPKDMREISVFARQEYEKSLKEKEKLQAGVLKDKESLKSEISKLENENQAMETTIKESLTKLEELREKNTGLEKVSATGKSDIEELTGAVRISAKELESILQKSVFTGFEPDRLASIRPVLDKSRFPGIEDMEKISALYLSEAELTGQVSIRDHEYVNRNGENTKDRILTIGGIASYFQNGFLSYSDKTGVFYSLSKEPSYSIRSNIKKYYQGRSEGIYTDISGGGALVQLTHSQTFGEKIKKGGFLVWPILGIGVFSILIGIERMFFISRVHGNTDRVMGRVNELAEKGEWDECSKIVGSGKKKPVYNVLRDGLNAKHENRETLESILQESILKELPKLERFLPLLNILGAISPLLGLLGTVTGMIDTFQVITVYGTGDPRMMSGGISTALITTMLGLSVAIPVMLLHTFLSRRVDHVIGDMEEKAVALSNIIFRDRNQ